MRTYELMVILDGDLADAALSQVRNDIRRRVEEVSTILVDTFEGNRRFAYEINHKTHGHYIVMELTAQPGALDPVEKALQIADTVVRHKVIRLPEAEAERRVDARANPPQPEDKAVPAAASAPAAPAADQSEGLNQSDAAPEEVAAPAAPVSASPSTTATSPSTSATATSPPEEVAAPAAPAPEPSPDLTNQPTE